LAIVDPRPQLERTQDTGQMASSAEPNLSSYNHLISIQGPSRAFPRQYFLDSHFITSLNANSLAGEHQLSVQNMILAHVGPNKIELCEKYLSSLHTWLPMVSGKRLINDLCNDSANVDGCLMLFLLCIKLCTADLTHDPSQSPLYLLARNLCASYEAAGYVSLRQVQSMVLLAVYELSHAIFPAAYLTIGRVARLGLLMGMHDRKNSQRLFKPTEIWSIREEQRRTWWAIFILDR
jgi:hypothetical protein